MRKQLKWITLAAVLALPVACVTINVYFPEAAAQKAAEQFVDKVIGGQAKDASPAVDQPPLQHRKRHIETDCRVEKRRKSRPWFLIEQQVIALNQKHAMLGPDH